MQQAFGLFICNLPSLGFGLLAYLSVEAGHTWLGCSFVLLAALALHSIIKYPRGDDYENAGP